MFANDSNSLLLLPAHTSPPTHTGFSPFDRTQDLVIGVTSSDSRTDETWLNLLYKTETLLGKCIQFQKESENTCYRYRNVRQILILHDPSRMFSVDKATVAALKKIGLRHQFEYEDLMAGINIMIMSLEGSKKPSQDALAKYERFRFTHLLLEASGVIQDEIEMDHYGRVKYVRCYDVALIGCCANGCPGP